MTLQNTDMRGAVDGVLPILDSIDELSTERARRRAGQMERATLTGYDGSRFRLAFTRGIR
jgi:hypothetical protein